MTPAAFQRTSFTWLAYGMLAYFAYMMAVLGPLMPFLSAELHLNYTQSGYHFSAYAGGVVLTSLYGDRLTERFGRRRLFWFGAFGMALGGIFLIFGQVIALTVGGAFVMGWLGALLLIALQAGLADAHSGTHFALAVTESNVAASISASMAPLLIGELQRNGIGWRMAIWVGILMLTLCAARFWTQSIPGSGERVRARERANTTLPGVFWAYSVVIFLGVAVEWSVGFWGADFLQDAVGFAAADASSGMTVFFIAAVLGRVLGSRLARRTDVKRLVLGAVALAAFGFPVFWLARMPMLNLAGLFIVGVGISNLFPLAVTLAMSVMQGQGNRASARTSLASGSAILIAPQLLGLIADRSSIASAYGVVAVVLLLVLIATLYANRQVVERVDAVFAGD